MFGNHLGAMCNPYVVPKEPQGLGEFLESVAWRYWCSRCRRCIISNLDVCVYIYIIIYIYISICSFRYSNSQNKERCSVNPIYTMICYCSIFFGGHERLMQGSYSCGNSRAPRFGSHISSYSYTRIHTYAYIIIYIYRYMIYVTYTWKIYLNIHRYTLRLYTYNYIYILCI